MRNTNPPASQRIKICPTLPPAVQWSTFYCIFSRFFFFFARFCALVSLTAVNTHTDTHMPKVRKKIRLRHLSPSLARFPQFFEYTTSRHNAHKIWQCGNVQHSCSKESEKILLKLGIFAQVATVIARTAQPAAEDFSLVHRIDWCNRKRIAILFVVVSTQSCQADDVLSNAFLVATS